MHTPRPHPLLVAVRTASQALPSAIRARVFLALFDCRRQRRELDDLHDRAALAGRVSAPTARVRAARARGDAALALLQDAWDGPGSATGEDVAVLGRAAAPLLSMSMQLAYARLGRDDRAALRVAFQGAGADGWLFVDLFASHEELEVELSRQGAGA